METNKSSMSQPNLLILTAYALLIGCSGTVEPGKWGDDKIIDIHAHIGTYEGYDLSIGTLLENIDRFGIEMALVSNIDGANVEGFTKNLSESSTNEITARIVMQYPQKLKGLLWAKPNEGNPAELETFLSEEKYKDIFVGIKIHPEFNSFEVDLPNAEAYLELCEKYDIPAVYHSGEEDSNSDPKKIYEVTKRHPNVKIVLYHTGFLGPHDSAISIVKTAIETGDADLYIETAQMDPEAVMKAVKELGADRVLFGTDATYYGKEHYEQYEELVNMLKSRLDDQDFGKIVRGNAKKLFKLQ